MKKLIITAAFILSAVVPGTVRYAAAQQVSVDNSGYYYVSVQLEKVYPYRKGYVVDYRKNLIEMGRLYLPVEWFSGSGGKADIIYLPSGSTWPHLALYYKDGVFSHLRLYVRRDSFHETWGSIPQTVNIDDKFENIEDVRFEFK